MKKIGIMSMQRIKNYGSFLQAYGLKKILNNMNCDVQFVDYQIEPPIVERRKVSIFSKIVRHLNICKYIIGKKMDEKFNKRYEDEFLKMINVGKERNYHPNIEHLIIGSDEVFNCLQTEKNGRIFKRIIWKEL